MAPSLSSSTVALKDYAH
jgi:hypothetical protein